MRDSTPGCFLRIAANSLSDPRSRSTFPGHPFFGSALTTGSSSKSARFAGLCKPRWRLTARRFGNRAGAARTTGTAWSVSPPSHMTAWVGTSPRGPATQTGTTGSTGHPALPSGIHRVCGLKTGKALSPCGIVPTRSRRRSTRAVCRTACDMQVRMVSNVDILTPHASGSGRVPSARSTIRRHRARHPSTSSGWARPVTRTGGNRCRTPSVRCRHRRQLPTPCFVATTAVSRTMQRTAFRSGTASVGWRTSVFTRRESQRPVRGAPGFFRATAWPLSTLGLLTSASNSGSGSSTLSTIFWYWWRCLSQTSGCSGNCRIVSWWFQIPASGRNRSPGPASRRPYPGCATSRAGPAHTPVGAWKNVSLQKREQTRPQSFVFVQMLEPKQQRRDVVPGLGVDLDIPDVGPAEFHPPIAHIPRFTSGGITENDLFLAETARNRRPGPNLRSGNIPVCGMESSG